MPDNLNLFARAEKERETRPLADKLRPLTWDLYQGLDHLDPNLVSRLKKGQGSCPSIIIWGPPGTGKTTLARLIGNTYKVRFVAFSAVLGGVKDVRQIVAEAKQLRESTLLFVDEIHRFNKSQQDAFLPHVENGTIILIGATTENPSFYLNSALLSRCITLKLNSLTNESMNNILSHASNELGLEFEKDAARLLIDSMGGDARRLINSLEAFLENRKARNTAGNVKDEVTKEELAEFLKNSGSALYDRSGEEHYNMISAFIKSMRGSNPDAALYWGFRMLESGEDPRFLIRRMIIFASEDIGNADHRALQLATSTADAYDRVGLPEGKIPIAQCITFLATAPKSNRSYKAMHKAIEAVKTYGHTAVPLHLRNAPTQLMKDLDYGKDYVYPHDTEQAYAAGVQYLPDELAGTVFYEPSDYGYEKTIRERLKYWKKGS